MRNLVITARMSSSRVPGKVLDDRLPFRPLEYLVNRIKRSGRSLGIVVATSYSDTDDPVVAYCDKYKVDVVRGPLEDVLTRLLIVCDKYSLEHFALIGADSPFTDIGLLDAAYEYFLCHDLDYLNNYTDSGMPEGLDINVVKTSALKRVGDEAFGCMRNHPFLFMLMHGGFRLGNFGLPTVGTLNSWHLSYDYQKDFKLVRYIMEVFEGQWGFYDLLNASVGDIELMKLIDHCSIDNGSNSIWNSMGMVGDILEMTGKILLEASSSDQASEASKALVRVYPLIKYLIENKP